MTIQIGNSQTMTLGYPRFSTKLGTCHWERVIPSLKNSVESAQQLREKVNATER